MDKKELARQRAKEWYDANKEKAAQTAKEYAEKNKEALREYRKKYHEKNKEEYNSKRKKAYQENPEHAEKARQVSRNYSNRNPELTKARQEQQNKIRTKRYSNDPEYKGDVEFLEYGDSKGSLIQCRYVPGHKTLDYNYQVMKLGLPKYNTQEGQMYNYMDVQKGETEIPVSDPAYAVMMKIHPMNKNSICRSPNTENHQWHEINELDAQKALASNIDSELEGVYIVKSAATSGKKLNILFNLIGGDSVIKYDKSDEGSKYEGMVVFAKQNPDVVKKALSKFKEEVQSALAKGESYDVFDLSVKGVVKVKKGDSKVVLLSDIPASGKNMLTWIWENAMEPNVFDAYGKLVSYAENNFK
jgi:hypothetical protein